MSFRACLSIGGEHPGSGVFAEGKIGRGVKVSVDGGGFCLLG